MNLREAAAQVVQAYDAHEPLAVVMEELRTALAEPRGRKIGKPKNATTRLGIVCFEAYTRSYVGTNRWDIAAEAVRAALAEPEHEIIARMRRLRAEAEAEHRRALEQGRCSSCGQELPEELKTEYGCEHCNHPLYAAIRCRVCGRDTDPLQKLADSEKRLGLDYIGGKE